ncbi:uncharacterized protein BT62DRAFT_923442 [Guyanagaster necrorhizus]|uniref:Uncharacterized protein n=1 Tax=Guyanagaster necrorhizus TaxID=856835 RepID=A0A9P8AMT0_9AGAR|nr:uncharacterized protein BT62DRAFT_923442 [Guyanagaster necrorhizus MCA 3950]KAG7441215.1 hypothetical protein BT62DRAFT_923442 [Guyanagaster necrorhizus MCA 3950]
MASPIVPTDEQVLSEIKTFATPLGRQKLLNAMRSKNNWALSDARLKRLLAEVNDHATATHQDSLESTDVVSLLTDYGNAISAPLTQDLSEGPNATYEAEELSDLPPPVLPTNPLSAQLQFHKESPGFFILYGRGEYDYAVIPNSSIAIILSLLEFLKGKRMPLSVDQQKALNENGGVQTMFEYYEAAGKKAGIPVGDIGRQFEAEYGIDPLRWRTKRQNDPAWRKTYDGVKEVIHKKYMIPVMKAMSESLVVPRGMIPMDEAGNPIYDPKVNGRFALVITKISKVTGIECGDLPWK